MIFCTPVTRAANATLVTLSFCTSVAAAVSRISAGEMIVEAFRLNFRLRWYADCCTSHVGHGARVGRGMPGGSSAFRPVAADDGSHPKL